NIVSGYPNNSWRFRIACRQTFQDPTDTNIFGTDPTNSPMNSWSELRWGATKFRLAVPGSYGNDGTTNLLTTHISQNAEPNLRRFTNFFIYISALPRPAAVAGEHLGWGLRTTFTYA
ncbi:MAG: hypothetical protein FWD53_06900, partial [Phycisphaerales bacterium]|nr:hypothetical protein [Phycisphaerales bacterium]